MISHEDDTSDDVTKYSKVRELTHIWQFLFYWNGAYGTGCYHYLTCLCELLL